MEKSFLLVGNITNDVVNKIKIVHRDLQSIQRGEYMLSISFGYYDKEELAVKAMRDAMENVNNKIGREFESFEIRSVYTIDSE